MSKKDFLKFIKAFLKGACTLKKYPVTLTEISYQITFRIFCALVHQRNLSQHFFVKLGCCMCNDWQVLQQNRWDNVAEYSSN